MLSILVLRRCVITFGRSPLGVVLVLLLSLRCRLLLLLMIRRVRRNIGWSRRRRRPIICSRRRTGRVVLVVATLRRRVMGSSRRSISVPGRAVCPRMIIRLPAMSRWSWMGLSLSLRLLRLSILLVLPFTGRRRTGVACRLTGVVAKFLGNPNPGCMRNPIRRILAMALLCWRVVPVDWELTIKRLRIVGDSTYLICMFSSISGLSESWVAQYDGSPGFGTRLYGFQLCIACAQPGCGAHIWNALGGWVIPAGGRKYGLGCHWPFAHV